ncbi:MAG: site-specific tyrosine recombinase XerD [Paludibacteraceae bacterium]|jgi:integrase/recombinase XerD|nr:site-specific tyrosine recombinase XerD [Paludibacteraceae bacterium]
MFYGANIKNSDDVVLRKYHSFLLLEKSLSSNTIEAYESDLQRYLDFVSDNKLDYLKVQYEDLRKFVAALSDLGISDRSQARIISGIKSFYKFLVYNETIEDDPTELLEMPKIGSYLPQVLSVDEIDSMEDCIDMSKKEGHRNRAIIETLYGSGLRVSELVNIQLSNIYFDEEYMKVTGKGDKERLVPLSKESVKQIKDWLIYRNELEIKKGYEDFLFLNRRGAPLTRVMIFTIIKDLASKAGIEKNISPHTFRHTFATHLLEGGANLRDIQQLLGHESILTTEIYTHLNSDYLRESIMKFHPRNQQENSDEKA